jgi:hypothetical protein
MMAVSHASAYSPQLRKQGLRVADRLSVPPWVCNIPVNSGARRVRAGTKLEQPGFIAIQVESFSKLAQYILPDPVLY